MKKFGTFGGVFTPTLLTILGVIMYLRLGWVVGNAGLLGAWGIIVLAFSITVATALSMASITTNTRIGAGGAYAIISQALGLEVGGSLGIPRYISQGLAVTMYIFGFREGWLTLFPGHPALLVDVAVFALLYGIAYVSADLAIKTQYIIMAIIFASLVSIALAAGHGSMQFGTREVMTFGGFEGVEGSGNKFWLVFAVFFPAATGIMAGANMSGELRDPRKSIPPGTFWAIGVSFVLYMLLAYWIARSATTVELIGDYNVMIKKAYVPSLIVAGVLGATFSSALASIIGSSRILYAMGEHRVLPKGDWLAWQNKRGQPRNAMLVTGALIFATMLLRDLNAVAPLVTMFFLITYAMLNIVVIVEQKLGLVSFRPQFRVRWFVPWLGLIGSLLTMFIINPTLSLVSWALIFFVYGILSRRKLETKFEDVRSGLFTSLAEWAAKHTAENTHPQERSWKPNLVVPTTDAAATKGAFSIVKDLTYPRGAAILLGITNETRAPALNGGLQQLAGAFRKDDVHSNVALLRTEHFAEGVNFANQAYRAAYFRPNTVFLNLLDDHAAPDYLAVIEEARRLELGVIVYGPHEKALLGRRQDVNVWIRSQAPVWDVHEGQRTQDLALLLSYKLKLNWNARIRIITLIDDPDQSKRAHQFLQELIELARLPIERTHVIHGHFYEQLPHAPAADINIFGLFPGREMAHYREVVETTGTSCLFVLDSGHENVLA